MKNSQKPMPNVFHRSEYQEQCAVFEWAELNTNKYPCLALLFGSLMGVKLPVRVLAMAKRAGMKKGKPDINLPVPMGGFCGLWIELKVKGNDMTPDQVKMGLLLRAFGNAVYKAYGSKEAIKIIKHYLDGKITKEV